MEKSSKELATMMEHGSICSALLLHQEGITISQKQIASKSNEIPAARPLLEPLNLKGKVVTGDALHTQRDLARFLVEKTCWLFLLQDTSEILDGLIKAFFDIYPRLPLKLFSGQGDIRSAL